MKARVLTLAELAAQIDDAHLHGAGAVEVTGLAAHSDQVRPGSLFAAMPGSRSHGRAYIDEAVGRGASAVLLEGPLPERDDVALVSVPDVRAALAAVSAHFYEYPSEALRLIGVTGTNGKTTVTYLLASILEAAGRRPGIIGTIKHRFAGKEWPASYTTPEAPELQHLLRQMLDAGATDVVMEVSSHGLEQRRADGCRFQVAIFTNCTHDHLDYHITMDAYFEAKARLFTDLLSAPSAGSEGTVAAINIDDPRGKKLASRSAGTVVYYGQSEGAQVMLTGCVCSTDRTEVRLGTPQGEIMVHTPLVGTFNGTNIAACAAAALCIGISPEAIRSGASSAARVPGRMDPVPNRRGVVALVDYAHTPDALAGALAAAKALLSGPGDTPGQKPASGRLIVVFGCGGDRDRQKRPLMGAAAVSGADLVVVTSDNPRSEDPEGIIDAIVEGIPDGEALRLPLAEISDGRGKAFSVEPDRRAAIAGAVAAALPGDVILVAGKGHEDYQIVGAERLRFDDREELAAALEDKN